MYSQHHPLRQGEQAARRLEEEIRQQADELDILRAKASQLSKAEARLAKVRERLEQARVLHPSG